MEKFDVKLVALDMDDTLLNSKLEISEKNKEILQKVANKNIYIVLCSGRFELSLKNYMEKLQLQNSEYGRYLISINGATVYDIQSNKRIFCNSFPNGLLIKVNEIAEKNGLFTQVYSEDNIYFGTYTKDTQLDLDLNKVKGKLVPNYVEFLKKPWPKMLIPCTDTEKIKDVQAQIKKEVGDDAEVFTSKPYFLEILPKNCGKGNAIKWLTEKLGFGLEKSMGFGDALNDESMIKMCKYGVAMKNGLDHIKSIAKYITDKTNEEDGVGDFLEKHVL